MTDDRPSLPDQPPARVTIARTDPSDVGVRQVVVRIDDGPGTTLLAGETTEREIAPGDHTFRSHNTLFWKTVPFTVAPGEHVEFVVVNASGFLSFGVLALVGAAPLYLKVRMSRGGEQPTRPPSAR